MKHTEDRSLDRILMSVIDEFTLLGNLNAHAIDKIAEQYPEHAEQIRTVLETVIALDELDPKSIQKRQPGSSEPHLRSIGDFQLLREVGRGGMGVVYEARQQAIDRRVALKLLPFAAIADAQRIKRFQNEIRAAGSLHHPNIVPIFSVGVERGLHYFAMQFIDGPSLEDVIQSQQDHQHAGASERQETEARSDMWVKRLPRAGQRQSRLDDDADSETFRGIQAAISTKRTKHPNDYFRTVAEWGIQIAEGLTYAHENGILHRDIKPGNVLLDENNNVWIADFGLARLEQDASVTMTGDLLGTLRYMAPEQALAKRVLVDHRADIYSLGATLYELLSLHHVLEGNDREELLHQLAFSQPTPITQHNPAIPTDLETVVAKALEKDPNDRFESAARLAEELQRFLDDKPLSIRPISAIGRVSRYVRQRPRLFASFATVLAFAVLSLATGLTLAMNSRVKLIESQHELAKSVEKEREQRELAMQNLLLAKKAVDEWYVEFAEEWLAEQQQGIGLGEQRVKLLEKASEFYEGYAAQVADSDSKKERARTLRQLASVKGILRKFTESRKSAETAIGLLKDIVASSPDDLDSQIELAEARLLLFREFKWEESTRDHLATLQESLEQLEQVPAALKMDPRWKGAKVETCRRLAYAFWNNNDMAAADKHIAPAVELSKAICLALPTNTDYRRLRIGVLDTQLRIFGERKAANTPGQLRPRYNSSKDQVSDIADEMLRIAEQWMEADDTWIAKRAFATAVLNHYGQLATERQESLLLKCVAINEAHASAFPDSPNKGRVRWCYMKLDNYYRETEQHLKGLEVARKMLAFDTAFRGNTPNHWRWDDYERIGFHSKRLERYDEAASAYRSVINMSRGILAGENSEPPKDAPAFRSVHADSLAFSEAQSHQLLAESEMEYGAKQISQGRCRRGNHLGRERTCSPLGRGASVPSVVLQPSRTPPSSNKKRN